MDFRVLRRRSVLVAAVLTLVPMTLRSSAATPAIDRAATPAIGRSAALTPADFDAASRGTIEAHVLDLALGAASCAVSSGTVAQPRTLTVIDYSLPSTEKRMWVFDLETRTLLYEELVAHGQGSGGNLATTFSNQHETHRTSLGLFATDVTYVGRNGYSLRLDGLDRGVNDQARARAIVMHGAPYVSESFVRTTGRLGRSWGCPAIRTEIAHEVIDRIKGGSLVFAYYPDADWLASSKYLRSCGA